LPARIDFALPHSRVGMSSTPDNDKASLREVEKRSTLLDSDIDFAERHGIDDARLLRRIDYRIVPVMAMLYLLSFLVRCASLLAADGV
jgi:hypothetical protein